MITCAAIVAGLPGRIGEQATWPGSAWAEISGEGSLTDPAAGLNGAGHPAGYLHALFGADNFRSGSKFPCVRLLSMSQRTRSVTSMKCWRPVTGFLICGMTIAPLSPAAAQAAGRTTNASPVNSAYAQQIARAQAMVGGDTIAKFFLSLAADPAKSFIMNQIGLETTSSKIKELSEKLTAIQHQLTEFQIQVTALIAQLGLTGEVNEANRAIEGLATFYRDHFATIGT